MKKSIMTLSLAILAILIFAQVSYADIEGANGKRIPSASVNISVEHLMTGDRYKGNDCFTFELEPLDPGFPMPEGAERGMKEVTIRGEGEASFGVITFEQPDVYRYRVYSASNSGGKATENKGYVVTITKLNDGSANMVINDEASGEKPEKITFTDEYKAPERMVPKTEDAAFRALIRTIYMFAISAILLLMFAVRKKNECKE